MFSGDQDRKRPSQAYQEDSLAATFCKKPTRPFAAQGNPLSKATDHLLVKKAACESSKRGLARPERMGPAGNRKLGVGKNRKRAKIDLSFFPAF